MANYLPPQKKLWTGRSSENDLYLHEKVRCLPFTKVPSVNDQFAILGYCCDEGVRLNHGRTGAKNGPEAIRKALGKMPNHLKDAQYLTDVGDIVCQTDGLENTQHTLGESVAELLDKHTFPIVLDITMALKNTSFPKTKGHPLVSSTLMPILI